MKKLMWVLLLLPVLAMAEPPGNRPPDNRPPDRPGGSNENTNDNFLHQGQTQQQQQGQAQGLVNHNTIDVHVTNPEVPPRGGDGPTSILNVGDTRVAGGDGGTGTGGAAEASGGAGGSSMSSSGSNIAIDASDNETAASAAMVHGGYCQTGGSGQVEEGGFAIANGDQFCEHIRMADRAILAYNQCRELPEVCTPEQKQHYLDVYHENLADADALVQYSQATGLLGRIAGQLAIPTALLWLLL